MRLSTVLLLSLSLLLVLLPLSDALFCGTGNCFDILGVPRNSTKSEIRRAYRRLSSQKHPDKRPNDAEAKEEFRKLGEAYEVLLDDAKRAKYEDFLDNPGKYWQYLMENAKEVYAPKSNVFLVLTGLIGVVTLIHWLNMQQQYRSTLTRMKASVEFKREVTRLVKSKQAATREEAEAMIHLDVVNLEEPDWRNLIVFQILKLPMVFVNFVMWHAKWTWKYRVRKLEYEEEDKVYLICENLKINPVDWENLGEKERENYFKAEVWEKEKCEEFMRMKRIEMNRLGKGKKKKKHTPVPYSEVEEVNMSE